MCALAPVCAPVCACACAKSLSKRVKFSTFSTYATQTKKPIVLQWVSACRE